LQEGFESLWGNSIIGLPVITRFQNMIKNNKFVRGKKMKSLIHRIPKKKKDKTVKGTIKQVE
jgi:hypothetical protein